MKKVFVILCILLFITFARQNSIQSFETEPNLLTVLENSGAKIEDITIHMQFHAPINATRLKAALELNNETPIVKNQKSIYTLEDKKITLTQFDTTKVESMDVIVKDKKCFAYYEQMKELLKSRNIQVQYFVMITGTYNQEISEKQMKRITDKILKETGAKFIEGGLIRQSFLSTSAYTPRIDNHITTGTNKININIALKYNPSQGKTKIILATPIIVGDY